MYVLTTKMPVPPTVATTEGTMHGDNDDDSCGDDDQAWMVVAVVLQVWIFEFDLTILNTLRSGHK